MGWRISAGIEEILGKGSDGGGIKREEALTLMRLPLHAKETYALMETADRLSRTGFGGKGENHFHIGIDAEPCPFNCSFCSLAQKTGIFTERIEFSEVRIRAWAKTAESRGADALNLMTTGVFSFERLLEIGRFLKREVSVPLVANTRDIDRKEGERLLEAGFVGAYHAVRLGEGSDTPFQREKRIRTIRVFGEVGLRWMNCVEPVGPEHSAEEIVELMLLARTFRAAYSGVMRRINFPGSPMAAYGMITELETARMVAVSRLIMGGVAKAHCTHEPHTASLLAGANLLFPEVGSSPRDGKADTGKGRGTDIDACRRMQREMGWNPDLPSNCFSADSPAAAAGGGA